MSMNEIMAFDHERFGRIRGIEIDGESWLVGKDVAERLGYKNPNEALADHVEAEDKLNSKSLSSLGQRGGWLINESGLYSLVLSSKRPEAKAFRRWVTHDVLPALRKTGEYKIKRNPVDDETRRKLADAKVRNAQSRQAALWIKMAELSGSSEVHKQICAAYASKALEGEMVLPLPTVEKTYTAREVGDRYGVSANRIGKLANRHGLKTAEYGMLVMDKAKGCSKDVESWRYNERGVQAIGELLRAGD